MVITIDKPCSLVLRCNLPAFVVKHSTGKIYHIRENKTGVINCNMPIKGTFVLNCNIEKQEALKKYDKIKLPTRERFFNEPKQVNIKYENCNHLARIYKEQNLIVVNDKFLCMPTQQQEFIILHELAHYHYKTEHYTDLKALNDFLAIGYNPSQAFYALNNHLSGSQENKNRVNKILQELIKHE